ncbi:aminotransferase [Dactylonectria macrodidyma]|uniref:Branched-chain-amino-acid aminotransferase n=1 Tax=Dactylonectria macrodidyma TaxID=307937 RepID=A0A9P9IID1_9HYPO|nr:aminotransferase [Dactylonectria macrodidyma]
MTFNLVPESEQEQVPGLQDPARMTQRAMTAHMVQALWRAESGWESPKMMPYGKIALLPTASVLHYATESFEGMKVYRGYDDKLRLFRPWLNCKRLAKSNARVCLPDFDQDALLRIISSFLAIECRRWLPDQGSNLYVRPAMIGSGSALGIQRPPEALFFLFAALFPQASKTPSPGIKLLASDPELIRAWPGGFGSAKVGASYGPAMIAQAKARENDCSQTLWLFGEKRLVTEAGASNFFVVWQRESSDVIELVTSSLDTEIVLDGITRQSVLELARERLSESSDARSSALAPIQVVERPFGMDEIIQAQTDGRLLECFVSGTAMFVSSVSVIKYADTVVNLPMAVTAEGAKTTNSPYASTLKSWLEGIMYGKEDHEWAYIIEQ